ncbi:lipocalin family protein [Larsenimonas rhizosphaerae]|uniref:Outer membrane lipoprotein Blc n=1 Tax=Larsenimonas rhizosphaerae TaxID=2944682 RepID=A0AA41ZEG9_9GAMM|nr:lipocalin family protein [Larsenimonas rhizosphaerae]MCX2522644.1 lipocalin family protein [Larsenimonas rhizosphaerae]
MKANLRAVWAAAGGDPGIPGGIKPVAHVDAERYKGTWYEIARLDHPFERRLSEVTASYYPRADGGLDVVNRGYDVVKRMWKEARGVAYPVNQPADGRFKVTFFWRFYAGYNIILLDPEYDHVVIVGPNRHFLWVLARTPWISDSVFKDITHWLSSQGFPASDLNRVHHERSYPTHTGTR